MSLWGHLDGVSFTGGGILPMSIPSNWGSSGPSASPISSAAKIITVPVGNPGSVRVHITSAPAGTLEYQINAAAFITVTDNITFTVANNDTLKFRLTGASDLAAVQVIDNTTMVQFGNCTLQTT